LKPFYHYIQEIGGLYEKSNFRNRVSFRIEHVGIGGRDFTQHPSGSMLR
jgi:hypothetical protein